MAAAVVVCMAAVGRGKAMGWEGVPPSPPYKGKRSAKRMTMQQLSAKYPAGMGAKNATKPLQRNGLQAKYPRSKGVSCRMEARSGLLFWGYLYYRGLGGGTMTGFGNINRQCL